MLDDFDATADLDFYLADFGVSVSAGGGDGVGILSKPGQRVLGGRTISTDFTLLVKSADFSGLEYSDPIQVDGADYLVRSRRSIDDGAFLRYVLEVAP